MKKGVGLFSTLMLFVSLNLSGVEKSRDYSGSTVRYKGIYLSVLYSSISDFPLSYTDDFRSRTAYSKASSPVFSIGYAYSGFWNLEYLAGEIEFHSPKFSDKRVSGRSIPTLNFLLIDAGVVIPVPYVPTVLYGTIGMGWMHQLDYDDDWLGSGFNERFDENILPTIYGIAIKISPVRNLVLELELKFLRETYVNVKEGTYMLFPGHPRKVTDRTPWVKSLHSELHTYSGPKASIKIVLSKFLFSNNTCPHP